MGIADILSADELALVKSTMGHFLANPDYATGEERGLTFDRLQYGTPLPMELVLRDWCTSLDEGRGGMSSLEGDCYAIYLKLYESGRMEGVDLGRLPHIPKKPQ
jgi:hypothetical protein